MTKYKTYIFVFRVKNKHCISLALTHILQKKRKKIHVHFYYHLSVVILLQLFSDQHKLIVVDLVLQLIYIES